jgi:DNA repair protein RecO (recombination protein O)
MKRGCAVLATSKRSPQTRVLGEPAYVLQSFDWSESSLILETLTRNFGRITLVAKGAKRPSSNFRPVLLPLQQIKLSYSGDAQIRTLKSAAWGGGSVMPKGDALMLGFYLNELLLRMLARDVAHPELFDIYAQTLTILATQDESVKVPTLRSFELLLLKDLGWLPDLSRQSLTLQPLQSEQPYIWIAEVGLREWEQSEVFGDEATNSLHTGQGADFKVQSGVSGADWQKINTAMNAPHPLSALIRVCAEMRPSVRQALQTQLRSVLHYHCGVDKLRTRQFMMDLQSL